MWRVSGACGPCRTTWPGATGPKAGGRTPASAPWWPTDCREHGAGWTFSVHSKVRPWKGTFADVDRAARSLAGSLRARGSGPGDIVVVQLPNWVEAGITFWAAAYLGAMVVPIVHFYGAKEVDYILSAPPRPTWWSRPTGSGTATTWPPTTELLARPRPALAGGRRHGGRGAAGGATPSPRCSTPSPSPGPWPRWTPTRRPSSASPRAPPVTPRAWCTPTGPSGARPANSTTCSPRGARPQITGAPVGHFIGMLNAFLVPLLRERPVHLVDVWDPGEVLRLMRDEGLGVGGGATYFLTSLLDHPDFTPEHLAMMPFAGLGGSAVPVAVTTRATELGIKVFRSYGSTEHPSITGCLLERGRGQAPDHRRPGAARGGAPAGPRRPDHLEPRPDCCLGYTDPELTAGAFDAGRLVPHR
jgi:acyl-CoA synthetase